VLLRDDFNAGDRGIAFDGDKTQKQLSLGAWRQIRSLANHHVLLQGLFVQVEVLEQNLAIAKHIEDVGRGGAFSAARGAGLVPIAVARGEVER